MVTPTYTLEGPVEDGLSQIRELYNDYFERFRFASALRDIPLEPHQLLDIRHALTLSIPTVWDLPVLHRGIAALESYIRLVRQTVLPRASELFGSIHDDRSDSADTRLLRRLAAYTLPMNLDRLDALVQELKECLPPVSTRPLPRMAGMPGEYRPRYGV